MFSDVTPCSVVRVWSRDFSVWLGAWQAVRCNEMTAHIHRSTRCSVAEEACVLLPVRICPSQNTLLLFSLVLFLLFFIYITYYCRVINERLIIVIIIRIVVIVILPFLSYRDVNSLFILFQVSEIQDSRQAQSTVPISKCYHVGIFVVRIYVTHNCGLRAGLA